MTPTASNPKRLGIVIVGDEILTGKVRDENGPYLLAELRRLGAVVGRVTTVADDAAEIAEVVGDFARRYDAVLTSGGVGPTHDDCTIAGVARAFGLPLVEHAGALAAFRAFAGDPLNEAYRRMAVMPAEAELVMPEGARFPQIVVRNVYIFPGVPETLRRKFALVAPHFASSPPGFSEITLTVDEFSVLAALDAVHAAYPDVAVGSYPFKIDAPQPYRVRITFESRNLERLDAARDAFAAAMAPGWIDGVRDVRP